MVHSKSDKIKTEFEDLKEYDISIYNSLVFLRDEKNINFEEEHFTFTVTQNDGNVLDLIKDGSTIMVNEDNRRQYV